MKQAPKRKPKVKNPDESTDEEREPEMEVNLQLMSGFNEDNIGGVIGIAEWQNVEYVGKDDDITSQGNSIMAPSPMSAIGNGDYFVTEFLQGPISSSTP